MKDIIFMSYLTPGILELFQVEKMINLLLNENKYIEAKKYGNIFADKVIKKQEYKEFYNDFLNLYDDKKNIIIQDGKSHLIIFQDKNNKSFNNRITLNINKKDNIFIKNNTLPVLFNLIKIINSPYSIASCKDFYRLYQRREIQKEKYIEEIPTVKDYSFGLKNAYWRMWFGKEYVDFFGKDRLDQAPAFYKEYKDGIYSIQLYESPYDWNTPKGVKITKEFKEYVGKDTFYDPNDPETKLKAPDFSHYFK